MGIAVFDLCYLDYNGAAEEDPPLSDLFYTPAAHSVSQWAGLMPSEKYNLFHSRSIPAISIPIFNASNPIGALRYLWPQLKSSRGSPGSVHC